jgi:hypothetical protein
MLDVGADVKADAADLLQYAAMGASYARNSLNLPRPRVGLLNVGTEEHKGRAELHEAYPQMAAAATAGGYEFVGFVEGSDIPSDRVDVIVTDGFTGNVALKTGEGTAKLINEAGVPCRRANKVRDGRPHIVDMIKNDEITLIVNTTEGKRAIHESRSIRREAVARRVTYYTTLAGALAGTEMALADAGFDITLGSGVGAALAQWRVPA